MYFRIFQPGDIPFSGRSLASGREINLQLLLSSLFI